MTISQVSSVVSLHRCALVAGNGSYILVAYDHDLHGLTIRTKAKGNSNNVFGYGTALLKISGHHSIEMSYLWCVEFKVFGGFQFQYIIQGFHSMLKL